MLKKSDLIKAIKVQIPDLLEEDIAASIDLIIDYIILQLAEGKRIEIRKFGSFSVRKRKFSNKDQFYKVIYSKITHL